MRRWRPPLVAAAELLAEETKVFERLLALCVEHSLPPQIPRFIAKEDHGVERLARHASRRAGRAPPRPAPANSMRQRSHRHTIALGRPGKNRARVHPWDPFLPLP